MLAHYLALAWIASGLALASGCGTAEPPPHAIPARPAAVASAAEPAGKHAEPQPVTEELWTACYIQGSKVGSSHLTVEPLDTAGRQAIRSVSEEELVVRRFGSPTVVRTKSVSLEANDGQLLEFECELRSGAGVEVTRGQVRGQELILETTSEGKTKSDRLAWNPAWRGFFADRQSLRRQPMKPRESRRLQALMPVVFQVGEIRLEAGAYEAIRLLSGTRQLLRIDVTTQIGTTQVKSILWTDERGEAWKTRDLILGVEAYLTSREVALQPAADAGFDLGEATAVKVEWPAAQTDPHRSRRAVYRASLTDGEVGTLFADGGTQTVRRLDDRTVEVTVRAVRPGDGPAASANDRPTAADSAPSPRIQSDDPAVVGLAREVLPNESDAWTLACALERQVKQKVRLKNYSTAMASAAAVAKSLEGDCTEHAMLLAALCRARKVPARVALGLVYYAPGRAFAYHMWTEVWIGERWIPLDATLGRGGIGAAHLRLTSTSMSGAQAHGDLLPIVTAIRRLQVQVVSAE